MVVLILDLTGFEQIIFALGGMSNRSSSNTLVEQSRHRWIAEKNIIDDLEP